MGHQDRFCEEITKKAFLLEIYRIPVLIRLIAGQHFLGSYNRVPPLFPVRNLGTHLHCHLLRIIPPCAPLQNQEHGLGRLRRL